MGRVKYIALAVVVVCCCTGAVWYGYLWPEDQTLVITGIVATNEVTVSPQEPGRLGQLLVKEGDVVGRQKLLARLESQEQQADTAYYFDRRQALDAQMHESEAELRLQRRQLDQQIEQAQATLSSLRAQEVAQRANLDNRQRMDERAQTLVEQHLIAIENADQEHTAFVTAQAQLEALRRQEAAQLAAVALARSQIEQVRQKESALQASEQMKAAADAELSKARIKLDRTEIRAPIAGIVDVAVAREGEYVAVGQPILTLINPDDLWIRVDIEESYVDRIRLGDRVTVVLPSGIRCDGRVFYRAVDADFATQRDVSRSKRDIKTFELRIAVDNRTRRLAVGMTTYVTFQLS